MKQRPSPGKPTAKETRGERRPVLSLAGRWRIDALPDLDEEYLREFPKAEIRLSARGSTLTGDFEFGLVSGGLDGRVEASPDGNPRMIASFDGMDEMHPTSGVCVAAIEASNLLRGEFGFHQGDTYRFSAKRRRVANAPLKRSTRS